MNQLAFLGFAAAVVVVGYAILWFRMRRAESLHFRINEYARGLEALRETCSTTSAPGTASSATYTASTTQRTTPSA